MTRSGGGGLSRCPMAPYAREIGKWNLIFRGAPANCSGDLATVGTSRAGRRLQDPSNPALPCRDLRSRPCKFASASSQLLLLILDPSKASLIAVRAIAAGGTDDADGADGVFSARAHPDHSGPQPAFTRERDLDSKRSQERLRPPQSAGERPRIFCPCCAPETSSRALSAHKCKMSDALPVHMVRSTMIARTQVAMGSASMMLSMVARRFAL
jgi:hypothetical protein